MTQIQLSDTQSVILAAACARDDGAIFPVTASIKGGAVGNVCKSLLKRGLIEEVPASDLNTVWRHDEEQGPLTLRATALAYSALQIGDPSEPGDAVQPDAPQPAVPRRRGSKQALMIELLQRPEGATIQEVVEATDWQPHSVRGAISGLLKKKLGLAVETEKVEGRGRVYRIAGSTAEAVTSEP